MNRRAFLSTAGGAVLGGPILWGETCGTAQTDWVTSPTTSALTRDLKIVPPNPIGAMPPPGMDCCAPVRPGPIPNLKDCTAFEPKKYDPLPRRLWSTIDEKKDAQLLNDLDKGYRALVALCNTDKRSLIRQAWLHGFYCGGKSQFGDVHQTWAFLPWHRAFIYFHERIFARLLGNPEFRLPVWDWENNRKIPDFFVKLGLPKFLTGVVGRRQDHTQDWVTPSLVQAWFSSQNFLDFCGPAPCKPGDCVPPGAQPAAGCKLGLPGQAAGGVHGSVHEKLVGGAMSSPATAAGDPIFYGHHANVDRFWWYWLRTYRFPMPDEFKQQHFYFYDEDQQLVRVEAHQLIDERELGYCYDDDPGVPLPKLEPLPIKSSLLADGEALHVFLKKVTIGQLRSAAQPFGDFLSNPLGGLLSLTSGFAAFPVQIGASLETQFLEAGKYYLVLLRNSGGNYPIAGFSTFCSQEHLNMHTKTHTPIQVAMAGSIGPDLFRALLDSLQGYHLVYGKLEYQAKPPAKMFPISDLDLKILCPKVYPISNPDLNVLLTEEAYKKVKELLS
jgi:polyphenol oxidase